MLIREMTKKRKSKKGFTLVELVVVIAILGILAAIALATVIMIIENAKDNAAETDAQTLDTACQSYMAGIYSGEINEEEHGRSTQPSLPKKNAKLSAKRNAIKLATVVNACEYAGLSGIIDDISAGIGKTDNVFVYDSKGGIHYHEDRPDLTNYITTSTTLGDLYGIK